MNYTSPLILVMGLSRKTNHSDPPQAMTFGRICSLVTLQDALPGLLQGADPLADPY